MTRNPEFLNLLTTRGILKQEDLHKLNLKFQGDAYAILTYLAKPSDEKKTEMGKIWGDSLGIAYVDLNKTLIQHPVVQKLPEKFARTNKVIPIYQLDNTVTVASASLLQPSVQREAERLAGSGVSTVFSYSEDIEDAIDIEYQSSDSLSDMLDKIALSPVFRGTTKITEDQLRKISGDQSVIEFTRGLLLLGVKERGSDIHVEPDEGFVRVRFRIDGVLQERMKLEASLLPPLISRLKILANLDIIERRRPQDGRITLNLSNRSVDFRFSSIPAIYGEKVVLRILGRPEKKEIRNLSDLDFSADVYAKLKKAIDSPNGIIFVTGPTGSGKTTTLYSALKYLNRPGINITTIEDPIEYRLSGINQVQVNNAINLDFASALRAFLRQDPDVILVGEVRDPETAKIASQAALTGHLVLTTMHTNNAVQAITRLVEIGVDRSLIAPSILGVMAQRLVRRICTNCREKYELSEDEANSFFMRDGESPVYFFRGKGCDQCNNTGYSGRIAIYEIFLVNSRIRDLISRGASNIDVFEAAKDDGFRSLRYDGIKKVLRGLTTIDEINRVTVTEDEIANKP